MNFHHLSPRERLCKCFPVLMGESPLSIVPGHPKWVTLKVRSSSSSVQLRGGSILARSKEAIIGGGHRKQVGGDCYY